MIEPHSRDWFHLRQILRMTLLIEERLARVEVDSFLVDRDEIDLTAFRLQVIGEAARKVSDEIKEAHPEIAWAGIVAMRNFIAHDYEGIDITRVWRVATEHLATLADVCRGRLGPTGICDL